MLLILKEKNNPNKYKNKYSIYNKACGYVDNSKNLRINGDQSR